MAFELIASHIQHQRQADAERTRLERLARGAGAHTLSAIDRLRTAAGVRLIGLGQAIGGTALRNGRSPGTSRRRAAA